MKLHLGAGAVYLREWVNVDLPLPHVYLAKERMDLVEKFITTEDKYYARHEDKTADTLRAGALNQSTVCDTYGSFTCIPARAGTVSEVLSRQVFEHLDRREAREALKECNRVLKTEGLLRIDVPDPDETLKLYRETGDPMWVRHLFGPRINQYGFHLHYTRELLAGFALESGFKLLEEERNPHWYPAFTLKFVKISS